MDDKQIITNAWIKPLLSNPVKIVLRVKVPVKSRRALISRMNNGT